MDINMVKAAVKKYKKYWDLEIGALVGIICKSLENNVDWVSSRACVDTIKKEVLLGTTHILRHVPTDFVT
eukprot:568654-Ditylum_brightwellii.AAC.1